jgi:D-3-phosphoglycerate dehydrogenase
MVSFAPGRNAQAAAEFTVGMMLTAMRRIADASRALHLGEWRGEYYSFENAGMELNGNIVGIVGFGAIGRIVSGIVRAFGAEVLIYDPYLDAEAQLPDGVSAVDLDTLMSRSRVVTLHARLSPESHHMINRENLSLLPDGAVLVNTARGGLLDYEPLPEMLAKGHLGAIALDVFDIEPPPADWPLMGLDNVVLAPHLAGATRQTAERAAHIVAQDVARFLHGESINHLANPEVTTRVTPAH